MKLALLLLPAVVLGFGAAPAPAATGPSPTCGATLAPAAAACGLDAEPGPDPATEAGRQVLCNDPCHAALEAAVAACINGPNDDPYRTGGETYLNICAAHAADDADAATATAAPETQ